MSRPRKPFGAQHPGRLPSTMIKVLAAEMSDPTRLRRGKQYAKDGSVLDIVIEPGTVTCEVQGSRPTPYIAAIEVTPGDGMPLKRDVTCTCTCPDDDNWDGHACKHAIASLFTLADELLLEPELLDVWRNRAASIGHAGEFDDAGATDESSESDGVSVSATERRGTGSLRHRRHLRLVGDGGADVDLESDLDDGRRRRSRLERAVVDSLASVLTVPEGESLPEIPPLESAHFVSPRDRDLASALREAIAHVRIDWD